MFRAPSALSPSGTGHALGFSTAQKTCLQPVCRGQGSSSGHIKNYEMRCAPSGGTLIVTFSLWRHRRLPLCVSSLPALGTVIRGVCNFYGFLCAPTKPGNKCFPLDGGNWTTEGRSGKRHFSLHKPFLGLPAWLRGKEPALQCMRHGFNPWVRKIP